MLRRWLPHAHFAPSRALARVARTLVAVGLLAGALVAPATSHAQNDPRYFDQTGYRVDNEAFWQFFQARGGVKTFGYPVSRQFRLFGFPVQIFQRIVMQLQPDGGVSTVNLLDRDYLPYTRINGSTFPAADPALQAAAPSPSDPAYPDKVVQFVKDNAPDTFDGEPVNFGQTFMNTVAYSDAFPNGDGPDSLLPLFNLQIWGVPTSKPAYDPNNHEFIYQRFQRGIMHYDKGCQCTQGLLLADYLKSLITGDLLPPDLAAQAQAVNSPLYLANRGKVPVNSDFTLAFTSQRGESAPAAAAPAPTPSGSPTPLPAGPVTTTSPKAPSPDYGLSMFLWGHPATTQRDLDLAKGGGFRWQKTLFQWRDIEGKGKGQFDWSEADRVVKASSAAGIKIIARIDFQPAWARTDKAQNGPPDNYQDYWDFVGAFANHFKAGSPNGTVAAVEVWNEVNLRREWGDQPISQQQAGDYVRLLTGAYRAIKAQDPSMTVITAGLSPTGVRNNDAMDDVEYMKWLFQAGMKGGVNYDVLGAHGNTQAKCVDCPLNSDPTFGDASFYFRRIEQLRDVQVQNGDANQQIWLLEFGWTSDTVHPNYAWFAIPEQQKADNIVKAFQFARQNWTPWIGVMVTWTMADSFWTPEREEYWWAITNPDGTARPAYNAIKTARGNGTLP